MTIFSILDNNDNESKKAFQESKKYANQSIFYFELIWLCISFYFSFNALKSLSSINLLSLSPVIIFIVPIMFKYLIKNHFYAKLCEATKESKFKWGFIFFRILSYVAIGLSILLLFSALKNQVFVRAIWFILVYNVVLFILAIYDKFIWYFLDFKEITPRTEEE